MNKPYVLSKDIFELLSSAQRKYNHPENRLAYVMNKRGDSNYREFLERTENIRKTVDILYQNHPFRKEHEFINADRVMTLLLTHFVVQVYNKKDELLGNLVSHDLKFYFTPQGESTYSVHTFEEITDSTLPLKFEKGSSIGSLGAGRYVNGIKKDAEYVKIKLEELA